MSLGGAAVMPIATALLPQWAADPDWKKRHAALICLAQIAEGCVKVMMQHLDSLVSMSLKARPLWTLLICPSDTSDTQSDHAAGPIAS